jgi:hypothetical protein
MSRKLDGQRNSNYNTIILMEDVISASGTGARAKADGVTGHGKLASLKVKVRVRIGLGFKVI